MEREQLKSMLGMNVGGGASIYKLNKVTMSGDDGNFKLLNLVSERDKGTKPESEVLGDKFEGVILKMRWHLTRFEESGSLSSTEYDDKWQDTVTVYPMKDKGSVSVIKEKYKLATQRILYMYFPAKQQIVRFVVKASGLTKDKNPNGELGLFEYIDEFAQTETLPCEFITTCKGVFREGKNQDGSPNKRKDHYAMSFSLGRKLTDSELKKVKKMMVEVNKKTISQKIEEETPKE